MAEIEALWRRAFDLAAPLLFFPIRHHSPACAYHLRQTIAAYQPETILIEGPDDSNRLIEFLVHADSKPPVAMYYSYADHQGALGDADAKYACYYPFLAYSPEYVALQEAAARGIPAAFIDLPYPHILAASQQGKGLRGEEGKSYHDDYLLTRSRYMQELCRKEGARDAHELWEKLYELDGLRQPADLFVKNLLAYCYFARRDYTPEMLAAEGCAARERYMAQHIRQATRQAARVLVVTGGFHTQGLLECLEQPQPAELPSIAPENSGVYPLAYTYAESDQLSGYASGMPHPAFYQAVFERICDNHPTPYHDAILAFIVATVNQVRKRDGGLSTADEIEAYNMAKGLSALRGKHEVGVYELCDAIQAACVKGELSVSTLAPLEALRDLLRGDAVGAMCGHADIPPIVKDFRANAAAFDCPLTTTAEQEAVLNIYKSPAHREKSKFFHVMRFLDTNYCKLLKGPDYRQRKQINLIRETWSYRFQPDVEGRLIRWSAYGGTLADAAREVLKRNFREPAINSGEAALLLIDCFQMGLDDSFSELLAATQAVFARDSSFYALADGVHHLSYLFHLADLLGSQAQRDVTALIRLAWQKAVFLINGCANVPESEEDQVIAALTNLYRVMMDEAGFVDDSLLSDALSGLIANVAVNSAVEGAACGLLYGMNQLESDAVIRKAEGYFYGTGQELFKTSAFLKGLFATGRDLLLCRQELLDGLDHLMSRIEEEPFLTLLPNLRMAFSFFRPNEIQEIGRKVALRYHLTPNALFARAAADPETVRLGAMIDAHVRKQLEM